MSSLSQIARPYAKAVFQLAREQSTLPAWSDGLGQLAEVVADDSVAALLGAPPRRAGNPGRCAGAGTR